MIPTTRRGFLEVEIASKRAKIKKERDMVIEAMAKGDRRIAILSKKVRELDDELELRKKEDVNKSDGS